jgi:hypothetical protein
MIRLLLVSSLLLVPAVSAGDGIVHGFDLGLSTAHRQVRDEALVPIAHQGLAVAPRLGYAGMLGGGRFDAHLDAGLGLLADRFGDLAVEIEWALEARAAWRIPDEGRISQLWVGPTLGFANEVFYLESWDDAHAWWLATRWLGLSTSGWHPLGRAFRIEWTADVAIFGLVSRPPAYRANKQDALESASFYFADTFEDPTLEWLGTFQRVHFAADLWHGDGRAPLVAGWAVGLEFGLRRFDEPSRIMVLDTKLRLTGRWGWQ